ncbi:MAG: hypothetical protein DRG78_09230 [Epsilonproteobacteria bacterium]|nr:MAG: hypothetical protein DRG78_09230 [Campylobacterota bacterium]
MKPIKVFTGVQSSGLIADFAATGKSIADNFAIENSDYRCKSYNFMAEEGKVYITNSDSNDVIIDDISNWPLGRSQESMIENYDISYDSDSELATFAEAIDVATAIADKLSAESDKIYIVKLTDDKDHTSSKTVLPTIFASSTYVANVEHVVVGNASNGIIAMPTLWSSSYEGDGSVI